VVSLASQRPRRDLACGTSPPAGSDGAGVRCDLIRSYRYRLNPTRAQERTLDRWLELTRELYNAALQGRRDAWEKQRVRISLYNQMKELSGIRKVRPEFCTIPIVVLRGVLRRLDRAFIGFFRRCTTGGAPGYPRFKSRGSFESILIDDMTTCNGLVAGGRRVAIPLLGKVKVKLHRPLDGTPKAMRMKRDGAGHWCVNFACINVCSKPLPRTGKIVGIDLGLHNFIATSDGDIIQNKRPGWTTELQLARAQRRVTRRKKGSRRRREAVRWFSRAHSHVVNKRREWHIVMARDLVARYDTIVFEDLNIMGLARSALARPVHDAAWGGFLHWLRCKAESAGREVVEVDPRGTSQECPECGNVVAKSLSERVHRCACGLVCDRDVAAARVILERGQRSRGAALPIRGRQRSAKLESYGETNRVDTNGEFQGKTLPRCNRLSCSSPQARLCSAGVSHGFSSRETP
jgi:putative transposase